MADWREKKADRFGSAGAPSYAAGFSTETAGAMSGVLESRRSQAPESRTVGTTAGG